MIFSTDEQKEVFKLIRQTIEKRLFGSSDLKPSVNNIDGLREYRGAFVTIKINKKLRGCIGNVFPDEPLVELLKDLAISTAFRDPRFSPLKADEYEEINVEISILTKPRSISDINEIEVGRHGLIVSKGYRKGLLLPQVPTEHNWNREKFLSHTCMKASLPSNAWKTDDLKIEVFEAEVFNERDLR